MRKKHIMAKSLAEMTHTERMAALMRELRSPKGVATAIALLEQLRLETKEVQDGYEIAVQLQEGTPEREPPIPPTQPETRRTKSESRARDDRKNKSYVVGGTLSGLVEHYRAHPASGYKKLRHTTRTNYEGNIRRLLKDCGADTKLLDLKGKKIDLIYKEWGSGGSKTAIAHSLITMLRTMVNFGATVLEDDDCIHLAHALHTKRFPAPKPRVSEGLNTKQIADFVDEAHAQGFPSLALAQSFQVDCNLPQKDCIGEWAPMSEPGKATEVIDEETDTKWLLGIRWEKIDSNLILRHVTSKRLKPVEKDLKIARRVMEELRRQFCGGEPVTRDKLPTSGPIIVNEDNGKPYLTHTFRRRWRTIADAAGIPKEIRNMDSVSGGIKEQAAEGKTSAAR